VFVGRRQGDRVVTTLAERLERTVDPSTGDVAFVLHEGRQYEGVPGTNEFLVVEFDEGRLPIRPKEKEGPETAASVLSKPTAALLQSGQSSDRAELEWRLSVPISVLVLATLAVPLSRSAPREGRYAKVGIGLLAYVVYANVLSIGRVWLEHGVVPEWAGLWWVHAVALAFALLLLVRQSGVFERSRMVGAEVPT
jgi:lipopolysaccharide export system permease protein